MIRSFVRSFLTPNRNRIGIYFPFVGRLWRHTNYPVFGEGRKEEIEPSRAEPIAEPKLSRRHQSLPYGTVPDSIRFHRSVAAQHSTAQHRTDDSSVFLLPTYLPTYLLHLGEVVFPIEGHLVLQGDLSRARIENDVVFHGDSFLAGVLHSFAGMGNLALGNRKPDVGR